MFSLVEQINRLLRNQNFLYAICGGWAIDLYLGEESRKHGDIDVFAYWADRDSIIRYMQSLGYKAYEMLGGGKAHYITHIHHQIKAKRNIVFCKDECTLVQLHRTDRSSIFDINFITTGQQKPDFVEFLFNHKTTTDLLYTRNHEIKRSLDKAILCKNGIPFLAPEICLLYKSTDTEREGYQHDYAKAMVKMNREQKQWLNDALAMQYPQGHQWRT